MLRVPSVLLLAVVSLTSLPAPARAETDEPGAQAQEAATKVVAEYLDAVKAKKWDAAKKFVHPKRLEDIAEGKKRTGGIEKHALAPWAAVKEHYLTKFELGGASPSGRGAVVVGTTEEHFSVEDKGVDEGVAAEYFVVPVDGHWFIVDRRLGTGQFPAGKVGASYHGYFEGEYELPVASQKPAGKAKK